MKKLISSPITGTIAVVIGYMLVRGAVYSVMPVGSMWSWFMRDTLMSVPRVAAFGGLLLLNRRWNSASFDWQLKDWRRALICLCILTAIYFYYYSGSVGPAVPWFVVAGLPLTTVPVALFEEYAFRGPLLTELRRTGSSFAPILVSSGLFTVFHSQAQSFSHWVSIFLTGVILANMRVRALSLGWLAVVHYAVDLTWVFCKTYQPVITSSYGLIFQGALCAYALATFPYRRSTNP